MRFPLFLLAALIAIHLAIFAHINQGVYYFGLLVAALYLFRRPHLAAFRIPLVLAWSAVWIDSLGNAYGWYSRYVWYDDFSHAAVSALVVATAAAFLATMREPLARGIHLAFSFLLTVFLMTAYEVWEYWAQYFSGIRFIWGEFDTALDLQWNMLGAFVGIALTWALGAGVARSRKVAFSRKKDIINTP